MVQESCVEAETMTCAAIAIGAFIVGGLVGVFVLALAVAASRWGG